MPKVPTFTMRSALLVGFCAVVLAGLVLIATDLRAPDPDAGSPSAEDFGAAPTGSKPQQSAASASPYGSSQTLTEGQPVSSPAAQLDRIAPILTLIGTYESQGNYNAYYGNRANQSDPEFTSMTLTEVLDWQRKYTQGGSVSSAVGKYQIIDKTIIEMAPEIPLTMDAVFDNKTQDLFAQKILEANGLDAFLAGDLSAETFGTNLAREWSSLPVLTRVGRVGAGEGYYGGHMRLRPSQFRDVLDSVAGHPKEVASAASASARSHGHAAHHQPRGHHTAVHHHARRPHHTARTHHPEEHRQRLRGATHSHHTAHERRR